MVVFRLTEEEYGLLKKASARARRSVSDFTRAELLAAIATGERAGEHSARIQQFGDQLSKLSDSVQFLTDLVYNRMNEAPGGTPRKQEAVPRRGEGRSR